MPGSVHVVTRSVKSGKRYIVRYRRGGRGYRLEHGGSFRRHELAKERERLIGGWLALGLDPKVELTKLTTEPEHRELASVAREWLESRIDLSAQSRRIYGSYLDSLDNSPLARADPTRLNPHDIREQVARWTETGLAAKSVRERVSVLRQILDFAEVDPNPARHRTVKLPARSERDVILPSAAEVLALARGLADKYRLPFTLLEQTAMRVGEVVSLERDDVDASGLRFRIKAVNRKAGAAHGRQGSSPCRAGSWRSSQRRSHFAAACSPRSAPTGSALRWATSAGPWTWCTAHVTASDTGESPSGTSRGCRHANSPIGRVTRGPR